MKTVFSDRLSAIETDAQNFACTRAARRGTTNAVGGEPPESRRVLSLRCWSSSTAPVESGTQNTSGSRTLLESTAPALRVSVPVVSESGAAAQERGQTLWNGGCRLRTL